MFCTKSAKTAVKKEPLKINLSDSDTQGKIKAITVHHSTKKRLQLTTKQCKDKATYTTIKTGMKSAPKGRKTKVTKNQSFLSIHCIL